MEDIYLFNTLSRTKEKFVPIEPGKVKLYTCGPTVYDYQHIGNLRTFFFEDILKRVLLFNGFEVFHVMNITDVGHLVSDDDEGEDKMEKGAAREGKTVWEIADYYTGVFKNDINRLNIIPPKEYSKATDYIQEQVDMIECLEKKGFTYITSDGVYYDTSQFPTYANLAKLDIEGLQEGKRIEFSKEKKNITDFALWKFSPKDSTRQMEWESPWGKGFPGWHIECSAMSKKLLGSHLDIHCGGVDHIPIHHTNEIAQSEVCNGEKYVNYWLHGEFLLEDSGKMSKSKGEFLTLQTLVDKGYSPMHYRYYLLNTHYRKRLNFSFEGLDTAKNGYESLSGKILQLKKDSGDGDISSPDKSYVEKFTKVINDDLNVTEGLAVLWELIRDKDIPASVKLGTGYELDKVLGLELSELPSASAGNIPDDLKNLAEERLLAKKNKDFTLADKLRDEIKTMGYEVMDTKDGYEIKNIKSPPGKAGF
ncbi:MAG: cysteine--tRNA ligase [Ignavibacteriae bacterium]|nr:cysteine--tRNA ligase [Ignavibacteriota bacterium]MCB9243741.1 cysteine--tRNA ligase [Ignavibacteriales bacterium]